jgi:hypothetical protein
LCRLISVLTKIIVKFVIYVFRIKKPPKSSGGFFTRCYELLFLEL